MNLMFWKKTEGDPGRDPKQGTTMTEQVDDRAAPVETAAPPSADAAALPAAPETPASPDAGAAPPAAVNRTHLEGRVIEALSGVFDPEIPVNIYELGLIYDIEITPQADVVIEMTLTSPACPVAESLPGDVKNVVSAVDGVRAVDVELVWDPPWTPDRMSEGAKVELGFM